MKRAKRVKQEEFCGDRLTQNEQNCIRIRDISRLRRHQAEKTGDFLDELLATIIYKYNLKSLLQV